MKNKQRRAKSMPNAIIPNENKDKQNHMALKQSHICERRHRKLCLS